MLINLLLLALLTAIALVEFQSLKEEREIRRQLTLIASLTRDSRSHQRPIKNLQHTNGSTPPEIERIRRQGSGRELPKMGRQSKGLKFTRVGGENERNPAGN